MLIDTLKAAKRLRRQLTTRIYGAAAFITAVLGILNYVMG